MLHNNWYQAEGYEMGHATNNALKSTPKGCESKGRLLGLSRMLQERMTV